MERLWRYHKLNLSLLLDILFYILNKRSKVSEHHRWYSFQHDCKSLPKLLNGENLTEKDLTDDCLMQRPTNASLHVLARIFHAFLWLIYLLNSIDSQLKTYYNSMFLSRYVINSTILSNLSVSDTFINNITM